VASEPSPPARPAVWVNCAVSADGRLAWAGGRRARLSSPEDLVRVQRLRANSDAILVGVGTVILDDPSLRVHWELIGMPEGPSPTRVVVDGSGRTPPAARVLDGSSPTIVATSRANSRSYPARVEVIVAGANSVDLAELFRELARRGIRRLMVEGGSAILASVLRAGLFDRFTVYYAPLLIGGATAPPLLRGPEVAGLEGATRLQLAELERLGPGFVATFLPQRP
jgi:2,5-diamino-6-(ribosylamino)-4(3H)-pyrimidinone 5'-phosphate reductase